MIRLNRIVAPLLLYTCLSTMPDGVLCRAAAAESVPTGEVKVGLLTLDNENRKADWRQRGYYVELKKNGFMADMMSHESFFDGHLTAEQIYDKLKPFHALFYEGTIRGRELQDIPKQCGPYRQALERYVSEGGGLVMLADIGEYWSDRTRPIFNYVFQGFGLEMLPEGICDLKRQYHDTSCLALRGGHSLFADFFETTNIEKHVVTEGVERIFLPQFGNNMMWGTMALKYAPEWTIVARGMDSAASYAMPDKIGGGAIGGEKGVSFERAVPGAYNTAPPVAAVRVFGKGRVFVYACNPMHITMNSASKIWPNVHEFAGDRVRGAKSQGWRLVENALRWTAEPAKSDPAFGSYSEQPVPPVSYPAAVDWDKKKFLPLPAKQAEGMFGMHTALSDGTGTVAEYVAEAKKAGLSFLVFNELFERMTPEKWERLRQECAAACDDAFYACPGLELTDGAGMRWIKWGKMTVFPPKEMLSDDGKAVRNWMAYMGVCGRTTSALISYRKMNGDPSNLFWFYGLPIKVYNNGDIIEDNMGQWLFALADLRRLAPIIYTGVHAPADVPKAAALGRTILLSGDHKDTINAFLNTRYYESYTTEGPRILRWEAINDNMENPPLYTAGSQRIRLAFDVAAEAGVREVIAHDQNRGAIRRFLGHGAKTLAREFELTQDQQRALTIEVVDENGKRAVGPFIYLFCYKAGQNRCGDNLNLLGSAGMLTLPDRHQVVNAKNFENRATGEYDIYGVDGGVSAQSELSSPWVIFTKDGRQPRLPDMMQQVPMRFPFASYNVSIMECDVTHVTEFRNSLHRQPRIIKYFWRTDEALPYAEFHHKTCILQSRFDYFMAWDFQRPLEANRDYNGGVILHEDTIRFKRDVELQGDGAVRMHFISAPYDASDHLWNQVCVADRDRGNLCLTIRPGEQVHRRGILRPGGYLAAMPTEVGHHAFVVGSEGEFRYSFSGTGSAGQVHLGFGRDGQKFRAGDTVRLRYLIATLPASLPQGNEALEKIARVFNADGGTNGYPFAVEVGFFKGAEFVFEARAMNGEAVFTCGPAESVCDMPVRVQGIEDNGCAAVYVLNSTPDTTHWRNEKRFRFVGVHDNAALFQQAFEKAPRMWVGNIFVAENKNLKLTAVIDGQAKGTLPFIEIHNPTDREISTRVFSPPHTPEFGKIEAKVTIPAGDSKFFVIKDGSLVP